MHENIDNDMINKEYEEEIKKKFDKIIEQTSIENKALKKILESLRKENENKNININKKTKIK